MLNKSDQFDGFPNIPAMDWTYQFLVICSPDRTQLLVLNNTPLFFSNRDGQWFPTLRLLHQYPDMMKKARVDQGAIKFVLSGANIMCPGLTSPGATLHDEASHPTLPKTLCLPACSPSKHLTSSNEQKTRNLPAQRWGLQACDWPSAHNCWYHAGIWNAVKAWWIGLLCYCSLPVQQ